MTGLTDTERAIVAHAAAAPSLARTLDWAAINTGTSNLAGLETLRAMLAAAFAPLGPVRRVPPAPVTAIESDGSVREVPHGDHLVVSVRPDAPVRLLLTGHMDTVYPVDHPFQTAREIRPGIINGPGVADMKGGIAVMLAALAAVEAAGIGIGYDVLLNSDEETGSAASAALIDTLTVGKVAALTYEPAALPDGTLAGSRPGSGNFSLTVTGRAAHAGRNPGDGRNALVAAADLALRLAKGARDGLTVNPARIDGGGPNNVVPDHATLRVNMRPRTPDDQAAATAWLAQTIADVALDHDVAITTHGGFGRPPKPVDARAAALFALVRDAGADLGQTIGWTASGGVCDGNNIAACGVPVVDTMGVRGGAIHSADEYLIVESLGERAALSALTIARLAARHGVGEQA